MLSATVAVAVELIFRGVLAAVTSTVTARTKGDESKQAHATDDDVDQKVGV